MTFEIQVKVRGQLARSKASRRAAGHLQRARAPGWDGQARARSAAGGWTERGTRGGLRTPGSRTWDRVRERPGRGAWRGGGAGPGRATASSPGGGRRGGSAEAASPALLGDLGAPCARLHPEGEGGACACAVRGRPAASQTPTRPRPPGAGRVTPALETELLHGRRWGPWTPAGIPPSPQSSPCGSLDGSGLQPEESAPAGESRGGHREMPPLRPTLLVTR